MCIAAGSVITLCRKEKHLGATLAVFAELHTWTGTMDYHPHVHMLVSAGGVTDGAKLWRDSKPEFLVPVKALSRLFRNRMYREMKKACPDLYYKLPD